MILNMHILCMIYICIIYDEFGRNTHATPDPHDIRLQPGHIQDLDMALQHYGELNAETQQQSMDVFTWFLHGRRLRECRRPRQVRLDDNFLLWSDALRNAWLDEVDQHQAVHYYVLLPDPPLAHMHEEHAAQIVLTQQSRIQDSAAILTAVYHAIDGMAIQRIVRFCPTSIHRSDAIRLAEVPQQVQHRPIQAYYGCRPILDPPEDPIGLPDGASIVLHVREQQEPRHPASSADDGATLWEEIADDLEVMDHHRHERSRSPRRQQLPNDPDDLQVTDESTFLAHQARPADQPNSCGHASRGCTS